MKKNIVKFWNSPYCKIILLTIVLTMLVPLMMSAFKVGKAWRVGLSFLVLNLCLAALFGHWIKKTQQPKWTFGILPVIFLVLVLLRYLTSFYAYLLVVLYLLVEYLAFLLTHKLSD
ncbi:hypothetical protein MOO45_04780 [Bombilactobacillus folatiphilus]|uniref:Integral membrane protein n=1 Tax=Bombilactobacillus folatiphilus TaxID=2923362 RepID=A0ABY4P755_9LACO|nr:hypothetical protein [Bombilactobacillus folatiphilus]UQS81543.1 hypothetical protein MOO45_04780 [Bombilactobacillus folatiphilus]